MKEEEINNKDMGMKVFEAVIPDDYKEMIGWNNIYTIPAIPKDDDMYLLVDLVKNALKRKIHGAIQIQADVLNSEKTLFEKLNYKGQYHSKEAILKHVSGATDDYIEIYEFPCCSKIVAVGDGPVSRYRADGCCTKRLQMNSSYLDNR